MNKEITFLLDFNEDEFLKLRKMNLNINNNFDVIHLRDKTIIDLRSEFEGLTAVAFAKDCIADEYIGIWNSRKIIDKNSKITNIFIADLENRFINNQLLALYEELNLYIESHDILISEVLDMEANYNIYKYYKNRCCEFDIYIDSIKNILKEIGTEYVEYLDRYLNGVNLYLPDIFCMKRNIFQDFSYLVTKILTALKKVINNKINIDIINDIIFGMCILYFSENYNIYVLNNKSYMNDNSIVQIKPYFKSNNIPIVMASSEFFIPYTLVTIQSIIENKNKLYNYDIVILSENYSKAVLKRIASFSDLHNNVNIRVLDVSEYIKHFNFKVVGHVSKETFYRLIVPNIFKFYEKIIYLDSDIIICEDISKLNEINLDNNYIAATYDIDFIGQYNGASQAMKDYCDRTLRLKNPYEYIQAGVTIFNVLKINSDFSENALAEFANGNIFNFVDQDVLNCKFEGNKRILDMSWNVVTDCGGYRIKDIISFAPSQLCVEYMNARKYPKIIHYSGYDKPWDSVYSDMAEIYWKYARTSVFYEEIISRLNRKESFCKRKNKIKYIFNIFFSKDNKFREFLKRYYYRFFRKNKN